MILNTKKFTNSRKVVPQQAYLDSSPSTRLIRRLNKQEIPRKATSISILCAGGEEAKILSTGMGVKATAAAIGNLSAPGPVAANTGEAPNEVDLSWPHITGAKSFVVQYATDPNALD